MRATTARYAILGATILALSGCRTGTPANTASSGSGWNWGWNRKSATSTPAVTATPSGPQLPSANATPGGATNAYGAAAPQAGATGYPDQTGAANPYQSTPYPGQPAAYTNTNPYTNPYGACRRRGHAGRCPGWRCAVSAGPRPTVCRSPEHDGSADQSV